MPYLCSKHGLLVYAAMSCRGARLLNYKRIVLGIGYCVWGFLALYALFIGFETGESRMVAFILLMLLGFPFVSIAFLLIGLYAASTNISIFNVHGSNVEFMIEWFVMSTLGAAQLFVISDLSPEKWAS